MHRFSTDDWPERDRLEAWREVVGRSVMRCEIDAVSGVPNHAEMTLSSLPGLDINRGVAAGMEYRHTPALLSSPDLVLILSLTGAQVVRQRGRESAIGAGEGMLVSGADPLSLTHRDAERFIALRLPRDVIAGKVPDLDALIARPIPRETEAVRLLIAYADVVGGMGELQSPQLQGLAASHVHDLAAVALGATRDAAEGAQAGGLRAARLHAIKADITDNLSRRDLSVSSIAARHKVTPRYVHMLFEQDEVTFSEFVLGRRLDLAHRLLADSRCAAWTITAIAFEVGFGDLSYFNRSFRRRFGITPSARRMQWDAMEYRHVAK